MERKFKLRYLALALAAVLLYALIFYLFPRKLDSLLISNVPIRNIEYEIGAAFFDATPTILPLTHDDLEELIDSMDETTLRRKIFPKKQFSHGWFSITIKQTLDDGSVEVRLAEYCPHERVLCIDHVQYAFYSDDFIEELEEIYSKFLRENLSPA